MAEPRMAEVADQLLLRARARKLGWREGVSPNSYVVDFPDISLSIKETPDKFVLTLIDDHGNEVAHIDGIFQKTYNILEEIYNIARRQTLDIDGNIDKALEYLRRE